MPPVPTPAWTRAATVDAAAALVLDAFSLQAKPRHVDILVDPGNGLVTSDRLTVAIAALAARRSPPRDVRALRVALSWQDPTTGTRFVISGVG